MDRITVTFFQRRPSTGTFSLEFIFEDVRKRLSDQIDAKLHVARFPSHGIVNRLRICWDAYKNQRGVNHITGDINFAGILLRRRATIQTILDCVSVSRSSGLKKYLLRLLWVRLPIARCNYITTISNFSKSEILSHIECDPARIHVIYVAVSHRYQPSPREFCQECPRILQVGTKKNKNIERLLSALKGIRCKLVVIGNVSDELHEHLRANGIDFENRKQLSEDELVDEYVKSDILAFASTYEGFGMPIVEANCIGRAVVTSNVASMPEVAGNAACLVDPFDVQSIREGITRVINDKVYREGLVANGFENAKRFHPDEIANQYLELYRKVNSELSK